MPGICLITAVAQPAEKVWQGFDLDLFKALSPPFPKVSVLRFDGCLTGHEVHLQLGSGILKQHWVSVISQHHAEALTPDNREYFFVDEGKILPFFLRYWRHKHIIRQCNGYTEIEDYIVFRTPSIISDWLFYPMLWLQFAMRKPVYRRYFALR